MHLKRNKKKKEENEKNVKEAKLKEKGDGRIGRTKCSFSTFG